MFIRAIDHFLELVDSAVQNVGNWHVNYAPQHIIPNVYYVDYNSITTKFLKSIGMVVISNDIDGNLMQYHGKHVHSGFLKNFEDHEKNFLMIVCSNSGERRLRELGTIDNLTNKPVFAMYKSKDKIATRILLNGNDEIHIYNNGKIETINQELEFNSKAKKYKIPEVMRDHGNFKRLKKPNILLAEGMRQYASLVLSKEIGFNEFVYIGDRMPCETTLAGKVGAYKILVDQFVGEKQEPALIRLTGRVVEEWYKRKYNVKQHGSYQDVLDGLPRSIMEQKKYIFPKLISG